MCFALKEYFVEPNSLVNAVNCRDNDKLAVVITCHLVTNLHTVKGFTCCNLTHLFHLEKKGFSDSSMKKKYSTWLTYLIEYRGVSLYFLVANYQLLDLFFTYSNRL